MGVKSAVDQNMSYHDQALAEACHSDWCVEKWCAADGEHRHENQTFEAGSWGTYSTQGFRKEQFFLEFGSLDFKEPRGRKSHGKIMNCSLFPKLFFGA
jgi:hypothetical protein